MATGTAHTITSVLQIVSDWKGESSTNTDADRVRAVSRSEVTFARRKLWDYFHLKNQTVSGDGSNDYTIGDATNRYQEKGLSEVFVSTDGGTSEDKRYAIVDFHRYKNIYNNNNSAKICYEWYDSANDLWKIHINPAPSASDTITYSFYWQPAPKTSSSDTVYCPDINILAHLTAAEVYMGEDEQDLAQDELALAEQIISEMFGKSNSPNVNQLYSMSSSTNSITFRGIGTY